MQKLVTCLALVIFTLLLSCQKGAEEQGVVNPTDKLIVAAQQYFDQRLTKPVDPAVKQLGPMAWYQRKQPQWGQAVTFEVDGKPVVEVPLLIDGQAPLYTLENPAFGNKGTVKAKNGVTKALFFRHEDGTLQAYMLKLIADEDYYAANSTTYQTLSLSNLKNGFSGFVMMTDWNDQLLDSYRMEKGNVVAATKVPVFNSPNARSTCQPICQNVCVGMSMPCCTMKSDPTDYCCTNTYMSCYPQCYYLCVPDQPIVEPVKYTGTASGQAFMNNYKVVGPIKSINIADRLQCFGTVPSDLKYKYSVTLYVDQPVDGTRDIANFSLGDISRRPGHTYLSFEQFNAQTGQVVRLVAGFYVQSELTAAMNVATTSAWGDDGGTSYDVSLKVDLSASQFKDVIYQVKNLGNPSYHLVTNNCTTFAYQTISPYVTLPPGVGAIGPLGTGYNPADLGQDLRERQSAYGSKMNVSNGAKSPVSVNCN